MSVEHFRTAQRRVLERFEVDADSHFVDVPVTAGRAHVLTVGDGPEVVLLNGGGVPAAMWAPLMAQSRGFTLHAIDLPGFGLTDTIPIAGQYRRTAVEFLEQTLDALGLDRPMFVTNSLGSLWNLWLSLASPDRVAATVHIGCPALVMGTTAVLPMRLMSVPALALARVLTRIHPPSARQVTQLSKMVGQHPLPAEIAEVILATEQLPGLPNDIPGDDASASSSPSTPAGDGPGRDRSCPSRPARAADMG